MSLLNQARVEILASRPAREEHIAKTRAEAMAALDRASKEEVVLFRQLRCDVEGTHDFVEGGGAHLCVKCGWITKEEKK